MSSIRSDTAGAVRTALVSAENLHLSLKSGLSLEEQALTHTRGPPDTPNARYCGYSKRRECRNVCLILNALRQWLELVVETIWI